MKPMVVDRRRSSAMLLGRTGTGKSALFSGFSSISPDHESDLRKAQIPTATIELRHKLTVPKISGRRWSSVNMIAINIVNPSRKISGAFVAGAVTCGLFAGAALESPPPANASCVSIFGIGNSADCTSTLFSAAFAIGNGATAHADGLFGAALAIGTAASAVTSSAPY